MVAASELARLMNFEGLNCEVCVRNTFIHVAERPRKRRMSAPADLAVLNFKSTAAQDTSDENVYSLDYYDSSGDDCDSYSHVPRDERPGGSVNTTSSMKDSLALYEMQAEAVDTSDENVYSLDGYDSSGDDCDSYSHVPWNERLGSLSASSSMEDSFAPSEMQVEAGVASMKNYDQQRERNMHRLADYAISSSDDGAHSMKRWSASEPRSVAMNGKCCRAHAATSQRKGRRGSAKSKAITRMFIGNLPCSMSTDRMVVELCKHGFFGTYTSINIPQKADGTGRGFGFVTFCSAEEAQRFASELRGCEFEGHRCYVNPAAQQSDPCISS